MERMCERVCREVRSVLPQRDLVALVLGGGYGRGEGGVWKTDGGDQPYNDLEFYVFMRGNCLLQDRKYQGALRDLGTRLSHGAGLHLEFKVHSIEKVRKSPVSMFSYDLVAGHRLLFGDESLFDHCERHLDATRIPLSEATRLLFNRCSGLLLAWEMLRRKTFTAQEADFIGRNLAKAQLALGDALLTVYGQYDWSAPERHRRLAALNPPEPLPWMAALLEHHATGLEFKLHPRRMWKEPKEFEQEHGEVSALAREVWLWLESRRLNRCFQSPSEYALSGLNKCPGGPAWKNYLLTVRTFGFKGALDSLAWRYPRSRLLNALALLLWHGAETREPLVMRRLQQELGTNASDRSALVSAYQQIWASYG